MTCPLKGHNREWLLWRKTGHARSGSKPHGLPPALFRASPTYILQDPLQNFITGKELVREAIDGKWGKTETTRLGQENSEDAVSWNVFRSLQEAGLLHKAALILAGVDATVEPDLYLWGRHILMNDTKSWPRLYQVRQKLEPGSTYQTEPDICLHIRGWGWIFIEAKFGSPTTRCKNDAHPERWKKRYALHGSDAFDLKAISEAVRKHLPEQLLRNVLFAHHTRASSENALVVALCRECDAKPMNELNSYLPKEPPVRVRHAYWEQIYRDVIRDIPEMAPLRDYYEGKSLRLKRAFRVGNA